MGETIRTLRVENKRLKDEVEGLKLSYDYLDRNWHMLHDVSMSSIRRQVGLHDGTVPQICREIERLQCLQAKAVGNQQT